MGRSVRGEQPVPSSGRVSCSPRLLRVPAVGDEDVPDGFRREQDARVPRRGRRARPAGGGRRGPLKNSCGALRPAIIVHIALSPFGPGGRGTGSCLTRIDATMLRARSVRSVTVLVMSVVCLAGPAVPTPAGGPQTWSTGVIFTCPRCTGPCTVAGALKSLPGWVARVASESRFAGEIIDFEKALPAVTTSDPDPPPGSGGAWFRVRRCRHFAHADCGQARRIPCGATHMLANVRCSDRAVDRLAEVARRAVDADHGRRLMVVGHSRGGMSLADSAPDIPNWSARP